MAKKDLTPSLARAGSARSVFVIATTPRVDAQRLQHGRVLARLRHHAVVGGDRHQEEVDPGRARDHRAHEPLVPGNVDDGHATAGGEVERRVAEGDRDPARLAPRGAGRCRGRSGRRPAPSCRGRCGRRCRGSAASRRSSTSSSSRQRARVEQQRAVGDAADHRRVARAQRAPPAGRARGRRCAPPGPRARAAAAHRHRPSPSRRRRCRRTRRPAAAPASAARRGRRRAWPARGSRAAPARARGTGAASRPSAASESLSMRTARASGCARAAAMASARPTMQPGLRPAQQLVARAAHDRRARRHRAAHRGLVGQLPQALVHAARADVVDHGRPERDEGLDPHLLDEAHAWRKFDWWTRRSAPVRSPMARS